MTNRSQRFTNRYGSVTARQCSTESCTREAKNLVGRCYICAENLARFAHPLQEAPLDSELAPLILRATRQRASHKSSNIAALEAHFNTVIDRCRGNAAPTYREHGKLTFNIHDREASALVRDISEGDGMDFLRCLDLLTALCLLRRTRPHAFTHAGRDGDDSFLAVVVETFRKRANIGLKFAPIRPGATRQQGYRKRLTLPTRLAAGRYLMLALGGAAEALAKKEAQQEENDRAERTSYWQAVRALESADS
jgi:hypothetical protein